jgi:hypothetical protein
MLEKPFFSITKKQKTSSKTLSKAFAKSSFKKITSSWVDCFV